MPSLQQELVMCFQEIDIRKTDSHFAISSVCRFPRSFSGFSGHFPGNPVLPAVIQLAGIRCLAERALECQLLPADYGRTKFRGMIVPDEEVRMTLRLEEIGSRWHGRFSIKRMNNDLVADGSCTFCVSR